MDVAEGAGDGESCDSTRLVLALALAGSGESSSGGSGLPNLTSPVLPPLCSMASLLAFILCVTTLLTGLECQSSNTIAVTNRFSKHTQ